MSGGREQSVAVISNEILQRLLSGGTCQTTACFGINGGEVIHNYVDSLSLGDTSTRGKRQHLLNVQRQGRCGIPAAAAEFTIN